MPDSNIRAQYIEPYIEAFPHATFLLRYPLAEAQTYQMGLYNDMTGDPEETAYWLQQMVDGSEWEQTGENVQRDLRERWRQFPVGGEFASTYSDRHYLVDAFDATVSLVEQTHQSFIGPKVLIDEDDGRYTDVMEQLLCRLGDRFRIANATLDLSSREQAILTVDIVNDGVAPVYLPCRLRAVISDAAQEHTFEFDFSSFDLSP